MKVEIRIGWLSESGVYRPDDGGWEPDTPEHRTLLRAWLAGLRGMYPRMAHWLEWRVAP